MATYVVHYAVGGKPSITRVEATDFKWVSDNEVEFLEEGKVVARFANVSAVVDSEHVRNAKSAPPQKIVFG
jgi:hypothetical protein